MYVNSDRHDDEEKSERRSESTSEMPSFKKLDGPTPVRSPPGPVAAKKPPAPAPATLFKPGFGEDRLMYFMLWSLNGLAGELNWAYKQPTEEACSTLEYQDILGWL
ncbi:hypothetical protein ANO14919_070100 [Xylariales sp. No.14919]|nr:hypothetical protein ANO14919_070100 [Xylariales sp. No.14919]